MENPVHDLSGPCVAPPGGLEARQLIVFLHGIGADGHDLIPLSAMFQQILPRAHCVAPHAPFAFDGAPFGRMWFSVADLRRVSRFDGARRAAPSLRRFLDAQLRALGLSNEKLLLVGFSQGAMMALHVGLRREVAPAGIAAHSGMLLGAESFEQELTSRPPVLLTHGASDDVLPVSCLEELERNLTRLGVETETHRMAGLGHGIDQQTVTVALQFAKRVFVAG